MECNLTSAMLREENIKKKKSEHWERAHNKNILLTACMCTATSTCSTHPHMYMHIHAHSHTHTHTHLHVHVYTMHTHTQTHTHTHTHTYTCACALGYTYTHLHTLPTSGTLQTTPQRRKTREKTWKPVSMGLDFTSPTALCKIWTEKRQSKLLKDHLNNKKMVTQAPLKIRSNVCMYVTKTHVHLSVTFVMFSQDIIFKYIYSYRG